MRKNFLVRYKTVLFFGWKIKYIGPWSGSQKRHHWMHIFSGERKVKFIYSTKWPHLRKDGVLLRHFQHFWGLTNLSFPQKIILSLHGLLLLLLGPGKLPPQTTKAMENNFRVWRKKPKPPFSDGDETINFNGGENFIQKFPRNAIQGIHLYFEHYAPPLPGKPLKPHFLSFWPNAEKTKPQSKEYAGCQNPKILPRRKLNIPSIAIDMPNLTWFSAGKSYLSICQSVTSNL